MNRFFAGAMMILMALCIFTGALFIGGATPEFAAPAYFCTLLLVLVWIAGGIFRQEITWVRSPLHWPVAAFILYASVRYWFSEIEYEARLELFQVWICGLIYLAAATTTHRPGQRAGFLLALALLCIFEAGYGAWQVFKHSDFVLGWERPPVYSGRASGSFIYPNQLAALLEICLGLLLARAVLVRRESTSTERSVLLKFLTFYAVFMIVAGIVLTRSRGAWIAVAVGLVAFVLLVGWKVRLRGLWLLILGGALVASALVIWQSDFVRDRLQHTFEVKRDQLTLAPSDASLGGRTLMWRGTLEMIRDHPFLGTGPGSWQWFFQLYKRPSLSLLSRPEHAHNDYLNLASDYGLVGFALVGWMVVGFVRHAWRMSRRQQPPEKQALAIGALVALCSLMVHGLFDFVLHIPATSMLLAGVLGVTVAMDDPASGLAVRTTKSPHRYWALAALLMLCLAGGWRFGQTALAYRYTDLGNLLRKELEYDSALAYFQRAQYIDPKFPEPYVRQGDIYRTWALYRTGPEKQAERRKFAMDAVAAYDESLWLNPFQSIVLCERGRVLEMAGEDDQARQSYQEAIKMFPANPYAYFSLGKFYRDRGQMDQAREMFQKGNEISPNSTTALGIWEADQQRSKPAPAKDP